ncbi:MAG: hypothetical protein HYX74_00060, partial [Acidobacteria bacterium]|nr:hypothetical protein [Acidobacteriota bacterium]
SYTFGAYRRTSVKTYGSDPAYWSNQTYQYDGSGNITQEEVESNIATGLPFKKRRVTRAWQSFPTTPT